MLDVAEVRRDPVADGHGVNVRSEPTRAFVGTTSQTAARTPTASSKRERPGWIAGRGGRRGGQAVVDVVDVRAIELDRRGGTGRSTTVSASPHHHGAGRRVGPARTAFEAR